MRSPGQVGDTAGLRITPDSRVEFRDLEVRRDGQEWIVGRVEGGRFVALPAVGYRALQLLRDGVPLVEAAAVLRAEHGSDVDLTAFVRSLAGYGFVRSVDGVRATAAERIRSSLPAIRPDHVRFLLHPVVRWTVLALAVGMVCAGVARPHRVPRPADLLWSDRGSVVVLGQLTLNWVVVVLHELGHLLTARAAGVPGRITLSTRLQFLCAQTEVTGVWARPLTTRLTVYLAGMAVNVVLAAVGMVLYQLPAPGPVARFGSVLFTTQVIMLSLQFLFFMRTDVYFVVQDLTRSRNLYRDASRYLGYCVRWLSRSPRAVDPTRSLPSVERLATRAYATLLVPGTLLCLGVFFGITVPFLFGLLRQEWADLAAGPPLSGYLDAGITFGAVLVLQALWAFLWWRRHQGHLAQVVRSTLTGPAAARRGGR